MENRRSFLINTALGAVGLGLTSKIVSTSKNEVEDISMCEPTTLDYYGQGPFYTDNPPMIEGNILADENEPGTRMIISGRILNLDCNQFIPNTIVDVWHANDAGQYDNQGFTLRGFTTTNDQGFYLFETVMPGKYLNGNSFRPSHIHYKITPPGFSTLTTQLYFEGDTSISNDAAASIESGTYDASNRIISLTENSEGALEGTFDIMINGNGIAVGTNDLHLGKGIVYKVSPNPFQDRVEIEYGVFKKAKVGLVVYDMAGRQIAILEDKILSPDKYISIWEPENSLPAGHYYVALKVNDLQIHYLKLFKS
jgi:protocatechuate 3,4-dioxygenase beta subunit